MVTKDRIETIRTIYLKSGHKGVAYKILNHTKFKINQRFKKEIRYVKRLPSKAYWYKSFPEDNKIIWVNPDYIKYVVVPRFSLILDYQVSHIKDGDWDISRQTRKMVYASNYEGIFDKRGLMPLEDYEFFQSLRDHFEDGKDWEDTKFYSAAPPRRAPAPGGVSGAYGSVGVWERSAFGVARSTLNLELRTLNPK